MGQRFGCGGKLSARRRLAPIGQRRVADAELFGNGGGFVARLDQLNRLSLEFFGVALSWYFHLGSDIIHGYFGRRNSRASSLRPLPGTHSTGRCSRMILEQRF